jgi:hypothetical protein
MRREGLAWLAGLVLLVTGAAAGTLGPGDNNNYRPKKYYRGNRKGLRHKINVDDYLAAPSNNYESPPVSFLSPPPGARQVDRKQRSPYQHQVKSQNPTRQSRCKYI